MFTVLGCIAQQDTFWSVALAAFLCSLAGLTAWTVLPRAQAAKEKERLHQLAGISFEGLVIECNGVMQDVNGRLCEMSGHDPSALVGQPFATLVPPEDAPVQGVARATDRRLHHRDGHMIPVELLVRAIEYEGSPATAIAVRDLTRHRRSEAALHRVAHFDPVTGLPNRTLLNRRMADAVMQAGPEGPVAVLCLNLDRFKGVNDLLGHATGNKLLVAVAERLGGLTRGTDTLAHLGGDEFAVVLPAPDGVMPIAIALAARIVSRLAEPFGIDGHHITTGASVGIALHPSDGDTGEELLRCADVAMNCAKSGGRGAFRLFEVQMDEELQERRTLERDLREAVEVQNLHLHYQPLVNCGTGAVEGYEALARWQHPGRGSVPPSVFIPLAENTGLILPLGQWVLEEACRAAAGWAVPVRVAVNLSPSQFRQPDLAERIMATLERTGLPPRRLEVEVTEGVLIGDPDRAIAVLSTLRKAGVHVSLDDFGTGYSSLSYIRRFPLDKIKIDRSFIQEMGINVQAASIVQALVGLAHTLNLSVTAEGVETAEQLGALQRQSCNQVQGYLLGRPAPNPGEAAGRLAEALPEPAMAG